MSRKVFDNVDWAKITKLLWYEKVILFFIPMKKTKTGSLLGDMESYISYKQWRGKTYVLDHYYVLEKDFSIHKEHDAADNG